MIVIRDATLEDVTQMGLLMVETWLAAHHGQVPEHLWEARRRDWTPEISERGWRQAITAIADGTSPEDATLVACDEDRVVGIASCRAARTDGVVSVGTLYVLTRYQGRGIGRQLLRTVMERFALSGISAMEVAVLKATEHGRRFYEAVGGTLAGVRAFEEGGEMLPEVVYRWSLDKVAG
jgi:ribosomal protein S18 acetylase RimI-like enzyme